MANLFGKDETMKLNIEALESRVVLAGSFDGNLDSVADSSALLAVNEVDALDWSQDFSTLDSFDIKEELYSRSEQGTIWNGELEAKVDLQKITGWAENLRVTVNAETRVAKGSLAEGVVSELVISRMEINAQKIDPSEKAFFDAAITVEVSMRMPIEGLTGRNHHWLKANLRNFHIIMDDPQSFTAVVSSIGLNQQIDFTGINLKSEAFFANSEVAVSGSADRWVWQNFGGNAKYSQETSLAAITGLYIASADGREGFAFQSLGQAWTLDGQYSGEISDVEVLNSAASFKATYLHGYDDPGSFAPLNLYEPSPYWDDTWDDGYIYVDFARQLGNHNSEWEYILEEFPENADPTPWSSVATVYRSFNLGQGTLSVHSRLHIQAADRIFAGMPSVFN